MNKLNEAVTCGVCSEIYSENTKDPLVLPCGHTFCRTCLNAIRSKNAEGLPCPFCRHCHNNIKVDTLSINYSLLNLSSHCDIEFDGCFEHGDDLRYWCLDCEAPLCSLCLYGKHPQGHNIQLVKSYVQDKRRDLEAQIQLLNDRIKTQQEMLQMQFMKAVRGMNELCKSSSSLSATQVKMGQLVNQIRKANNIKTIMLAETAVKDFQAKMTRFEIQHTPKEAKISDGMHADEKNKNERTKCKYLDEVGQQATGVCGAEDVKRISKDAGEVPRAALECLDGRMLLHCMASPIGTRISLKLPCEVFLELSVGNECIGRVYIRLWCHLRRAQQFQSLCLGNLGPSYLGIQAGRVQNKKMAGEMIIFENMMEMNRPVNTRTPLNNLEWAGNFGKVVNEGHVFAYESGRTSAGMNPGFAICTRSTRGGGMGTPFAEVVSGLDVVKTAIEMDRHTEIKITQCGIVLPDFTL